MSNTENYSNRIDWNHLLMASVEVNGRGQIIDSDRRELADFGSLKAARQFLTLQGWTQKPWERGEWRGTTVFLNPRYEANLKEYLANRKAEDKAQREALNWCQFGKVIVEPGGSVLEETTCVGHRIAQFDNQKDAIDFLRKAGWLGPFRVHPATMDQRMRNPKASE